MKLNKNKKLKILGSSQMCCLMLSMTCT